MESLGVGTVQQRRPNISSYYMGKHKFRLSDMIPRAWLRKLNPPGSNLTNPRTLLHHDCDQPRQRKSYQFSRQFDAVQPRHPSSPPRRSTSKRRRSALFRRPTRRSTTRRLTAAVSSGCSCCTLTDLDSVREKPECRVPISPSRSLSSTEAVFLQSPPSLGHSSGSVPSSESFDHMVSRTTTSSSCRCRADLDTLEEGLDRDPMFEFELELELPAVITKPLEFNEMVMNLRRPGENKKPFAASSGMNSTSAISVTVVEEGTRNRAVKSNKEHKKPRTMGNSSVSPAGGIRLRVNSPKLATRKLNQARLQGRKILSASASSRPVTNLGSTARTSVVSDGFAVVKSSSDPGKDFMESMVDMITENDIRSSKDLEDLLACYLMLNSYEYHDLIVGVFEKIWFDLYGSRSK